VRPRLPDIIEHDGIRVVRDDAYPGGTKARVLPVLLQGGHEFVYASPVQGYAQVALAYAARQMGKRATIFCAQRKAPHERTREAAEAGARIVEVPNGYMSVVRARARSYCAVSGAELLPFGLDTPMFVAALGDLAARLPIREPSEVWTVAGSGVLTRALQLAWPGAEFHAVRIGAAPDVGRAFVHRAPEPFEQPARRPPPFPSCTNYDAKAWQFITAHARPGAVFWNVAK
jgi:hypothetical protein